ncbi:MAG: Gfo/Idh/MocA family oxidoreductase, partial [Spirulinaceae cyanobacterium RM2_2_10]|nr:Gfo/Idh/MocA family oxidoreductase [Spirulinaceae cyanobacterium RM2_2_10]
MNIALIGGGGIAETAFSQCTDHNVIAIADVDEQRGAPAFKEYPEAKQYKDFRRLLDRHYKELDLAIISTPDHTHFAATYGAMERGISVHTQKPLTHNLWEARTLQSAAHRFKVHTVMGNQGHTMEGMRYIREWYEAGLLGTVREVHAWTNRTTTNSANARMPLPLAQPVPGTLDWDLWLGPRSERAYNEAYCPGRWRWWWDFGLGGLGDIGCHALDIPVYALQLGYPSKVSMSSLDFSHEVGAKSPKEEAATYVYEFPETADRPGVTVYWYEGGRLPRFPEDLRDSETGEISYAPEGGCLLMGTGNSIYSLGMRPTSPRLVKDWDELRRQLPAKAIPRAIGGPIREVIGSICGEIKEPGSNFDYAAPLTEIVILGTIANRAQKVVEYNPVDMTFRDLSLNVYVKESVR